jgi:hypothetical protein
MRWALNRHDLYFTVELYWLFKRALLIARASNSTNQGETETTGQCIYEFMKMSESAYIFPLPLIPLIRQRIRIFIAAPFYTLIKTRTTPSGLLT